MSAREALEYGLVDKLNLAARARAAEVFPPPASEGT